MPGQVAIVTSKLGDSLPKDEFLVDGWLDDEKWGFDVEGNKWGWGNNELQAYTTNRPENCVVEDGKLKIIARGEDFHDPVSDKDFRFTSSRIISKNKGDWLYGRFVIRAKIPVGVGSWPAIWMLPTDWVYGDWPTSGEIDIMEHVGYDEGRIHASAHTLTYNHTKNTQ